MAAFLNSLKRAQEFQSHCRNHRLAMPYDEARHALPIQYCLALAGYDQHSKQLCTSTHKAPEAA